LSHFTVFWRTSLLRFPLKPIGSNVLGLIQQALITFYPII
jgi:hypothetical protein